MAVVAEELISDLIVRDSKLKSGIRSAQQTYGRGISNMTRDQLRFESTFKQSSNNISSSFKRMAGTIAAGLSISAATQMIDSFTRLQNNLRVAGLEGEKLAAVQENLLDLSSRYGVSVENLSSVFLKAALVQDELGASTEQIIQLNEITAASLKITGTSAQEASGALLQLGQSLGSGVVRAEEFNSILEGALPLAQAAARGIDGFGGSVSKLRAAIADGQITSEQFFQGIMRGGVQTLAEAEKATLTLSGAFEALTSRLTVYIGEAAKTSGVTAALAAAISALADNLETIIPALSVIATIMAGRFVGGIIAGSNAMRALSAYSAIATTSLAGTALAARGAGTALLAAFGGPVGVAILAVGAALYYASEASSALDRTTDNLTSTLEQEQLELDRLIGKLDDAGVSTDKLKDASFAAAEGADTSAAAFKRAADRAEELGRKSGLAAVKMNQLRIIEAQTARAQLESRIDRRGASIASQTRTGDALATGVGARRNAEDRARIEELNQVEQIARKSIVAITTLASKGISIEDTPTPAAIAAEEKKKPKRRGRAGRTAAEIEDRFNSELNALAQQTLSAQQSVADSAEERAELEMRAVELARLETLKGIADNEDYTEAQKQRLALQVEALADFERERVNRDLQREISDREIEASEEGLRYHLDALRGEASMARTREDRLEKELEILEALDRREKAELDAAIDAGRIADAKKAEADLATSQATRRAGVERDGQSPLERYADDGGDIRDQAERLVIRKIEDVNDGIANAIAAELGVKDQFVKDLFSLFLEETIFRPLAQALQDQQGAGGGLLGAIGSVIGGLFGGGRASGGPVSAGRIYRVNEGAQEFFQPATDGRIIQGSQAQAARPGGGAAGAPIVVELAVGPGQMFEPTVQAISGDVSVRTVQAATPGIVQAAGVNISRRSQRPRV